MARLAFKPRFWPHVPLPSSPSPISPYGLEESILSGVNEGRAEQMAPLLDVQSYIYHCQIEPEEEREVLSAHGRSATLYDGRD
jgi:hypothetical protein